MSKQTDILKQVVAMDGGEKFPVLSVIRTNPGLAAAVSKLRSDGTQPRYSKGGQRELMPPNSMAFRHQSEKTMDEIKDAEGVMQILPDIELSAQILTSSTLSPKDMVTVELLFAGPEGVLPNQVGMEILALIRKHFEQTYKIKNDLEQILRDMLFEKGAHIRMVLPENSLDEFVNRHVPLAMAMESLNHGYHEVFDINGRPKNIGILGPGSTGKFEPESAMKFESFGRGVQTTVDGEIAIESYRSYNDQGAPVGNDKVVQKNDYLFVTDNFAVLSAPRAMESIRTLRINEKLRRKKTHVGMESFADQQLENQRNVVRSKLTDRELSSVLFKNASMKADNISSLKTQQQLQRTTIGNPLVMELPTESVIPVHVPGQPEKHVGYFVLLDNTGHPISIKNRSDYYSDLAGRMGSNIGTSSLPSQVIARTKSMMGGFDCSNTEHLDYSAKVYGDLITADLLARLRNGIYTNGVALGSNDDVYRIMLARTLQQQRTQILFVPVELVTYFAFRYNADGIGRSILSDTKIINALRSTLMFANTMAAIRNSIGMTTVDFKLDPEDPDPTKSLEIMMNEVLRSRQQAFPLNTASPADIVYQLQRGGYQFTYSDHPGLPDVKVEFGERNSNYPKPDTELEESLRKRSIMAFGLNPETVDTAFSGEFATTVTQNNILLTRRVMQLQDRFTPLLTDHIVKYIRASEGMMADIQQLIEDNYDKIKLPTEIEEKFNFGENVDIRKKVEKSIIVEYLQDMFLTGLQVNLPRPDTVTIENQATAFEAYVKLLDLALDAWLNKDFFTQELTGDIQAVVDGVKASVKAYYVRKWFADNGVMPELAEMTAQDAEGTPRIQFWNEQKNHIESLMKSLAGLTAGLKPMQEATNKVASDVGIQAGGGFGGGGGGFGGGDFGGGDVGGGGDDFGLGGDIGNPTAGGEPGTGGDETGTTPENPEGEPDDETPPEGDGNLPQNPDQL